MSRRKRAILFLGMLPASAGLWVLSYFNLEFTSFDNQAWLSLGSVAWVDYAAADKFREWGTSAEEIERYRRHYGSTWKWLGYSGGQTLWAPRIGELSPGRGILLPLWIPTALLTLLSAYYLLTIRPPEQSFFAASRYDLQAWGMRKSLTACCLAIGAASAALWSTQWLQPMALTSADEYTPIALAPDPSAGWTVREHSGREHMDPWSSGIVAGFVPEGWRAGGRPEDAAGKVFRIGAAQSSAGQSPAPGFWVVGLGHGVLEFKQHETLTGIAPTSSPRPTPIQSVTTLKRRLRIPLALSAIVCLAGGGLLRAVPFYLRLIRRRCSRCTNCGYDLRGSTDCCPECGTPIAFY